MKDERLMAIFAFCITSLLANSKNASSSTYVKNYYCVSYKHNTVEGLHISILRKFQAWVFL